MLTQFRFLWLPCLIALCIVSLAPAARADQWNKMTYVTFSGPVEIPGRVLPAGSYVFRLLDSNANRNIVQIYNRDQNQLFATVLAIPDYRQNPTSHTVIEFEERPTGNPEALKEWFYPGDQYGVEFVYPHDQATRIARRTNQNVLSMGDEMQSNMSSQVKSASDPAVRAMENTDVTAVDPTGKQIDSNQVVNSKPQH